MAARSEGSHGPDQATRPYALVKLLSWSFFFLLFAFSVVMSVFLTNYAESILLTKQKQFALLMARNINHQVYRRFILPTIIGYNSVNLSNPEQLARLDQIIQSTVHSFHVLEVNIYGLDQEISYSSNKELINRKDLAGEFVKRAISDNTYSFEMVNRLPALLSLFMVNMKPGSVVLKTVYPLTAEATPNMPFTGTPVIGILEFSQDITEDYVSVINFERLTILFSFISSLFLFLVMVMIIRRADRINSERLAERERYERELVQQEKLAGMGRVVASIAHEIRNPLGIIRSSAELLLGKATGDEASPQRRLLQAVYDESKRLSRTMSDFLDYARPKQPKSDPVDVGRLLDQVLVFMEAETAKREIVVERDWPQGLVVPGDKDLLYRAFYNVTANAIQAVGSKGRVTVSGSSDKDGIRVVFTDTGPGFADKTLKQATDPFFTTKDTGTGLGLAITANIVESHQGRLAISNGQDHGAVVEITLPSKKA